MQNIYEYNNRDLFPFLCPTPTSQQTPPVRYTCCIGRICRSSWLFSSSNQNIFIVPVNKKKSFLLGRVACLMIFPPFLFAKKGLQWLLINLWLIILLAQIVNNALRPFIIMNMAISLDYHQTIPEIWLYLQGT